MLQKKESEPDNRAWQSSIVVNSSESTPFWFVLDGCNESCEKGNTSTIGWLLMLVRSYAKIPRKLLPLHKNSQSQCWAFHHLAKLLVLLPSVLWAAKTMKNERYTFWNLDHFLPKNFNVFLLWNVCRKFSKRRCAKTLNPVVNFCLIL